MNPRLSLFGPRLDAWLKDLESEDRIVRHTALDFFSRKRAQPVIRSNMESVLPVIARLLRHEFEPTRFVVASKLQHLVADGTTFPDTLCALVEPSLRDPAFGVRYSVARVLGTRSANKAVTLSLALKFASEYDVNARMTATTLLEALNTPTTECMRTLLVLSRDEDPRVRRWSASALAELWRDSSAVPEEEVVAALVRQLTDEDVRVRCRAAGSLAALRGKGYNEARPLLLEGLRGEDRAVRKAFASAVAGMGGADDVELQILAALLKDSDPSTRHTALDLLEARSDRRTSPATRDLLLEALRDTQWSIRNSAAYALKRAAIEPATVVPALQAAKRAERAFVRRFELGLLLEEVTRPFFPWRAWAMVPVILFIFLPYHLLIRPCLPQPVHLVLGAGLSVKNGRKAVRFLVAALDHPEPEIRRRAAKYLGWYGPKAKLALDRLKAATHDEDEGVRRAASDAVEALTGRS